MNKHYVDWEEINALVFRLFHKIITNSSLFNDLEIENIYGLPRGGLIPAVMLSHQLGIPMAKGDIGPNTLIVDDICDSGETLDKFVRKYQTLYKIIKLKLTRIFLKFYNIYHCTPKKDLEKKNETTS